MKVSQLSNKISTTSINKILETRFGFTVDFNSLTPHKARRLLTKLTESMATIRQSYCIHTAEKNSHYMELLMVTEGVNKYFKDCKQTTNPVSLPEPLGTQNINHMRRAITLAEAGNSVPAKYVSSFTGALRLAERINTRVNEGQMGEASVLLASKDIVDTMQDMIEKLSKLQNEKMPALLDRIHDEIGSEEGDQFDSSITQMLTPLLDQLRTAREDAANASRVLGGAKPTDMKMPEETEVDMENEPEAETDGFDSSDAASGDTFGLGRDTR